MKIKINSAERERQQEFRKLKSETLTQAINKKDSCLRAENQMKPIIKVDKRTRKPSEQEKRIKHNEKIGRMGSRTKPKNQSKKLKNFTKRFSEVRLSNKDVDYLQSQIMF